MFLGIPVETTGDFLDLALSALAGIFVIVGLVLVLVLVRVFKILGYVREITESISEIVELVNHYLWKPVQFFNNIAQKIRKLLKR